MHVSIGNVRQKDGSYRAEFGITPAQQRREYKAASHRLPLPSRDFRDW